MEPQTQQNRLSNLDFPIRPIWLLKLFVIKALPIIVYVAFLLFTSSYSSSNERNWIVYLIILFIFATDFLLNIIRYFTFKYTFYDTYLELHQSFLSKENRNIPYSVIQNVIIDQSLLDRVFGISTVVLENAVQEAQPVNPKYSKYQNGRRLIGISIGFRGNAVEIPGLIYTDASRLRDEILQKTRENKTKDLGL